MRKQTILSLAVIATLPLTAYADITYVQTNTPVFVGKEGTANIAPHDAPYAVAEITNDDATHIASTAYVKGAYNDAIAGINTVNKSLASKISNKQDGLIYNSSNGIQSVGAIVQTDLSKVKNDSTLVNGMAVKNAINGVNNTISNKRVEIYTSWDDDTATQQVGLTNYVEPKD